MRSWLYPLHYERRYSKFLENSLTEIQREFYARLQTFPEWNSDNIDKALDDALISWRQKREEKKRNYYGYFLLINAFNSKQFRAVVKDGTGLTLPAPGELASLYSDLLARFGETADVFGAESWLPETQKIWVSAQDDYVNKAVTNTLSDAAVIVKNSVLTSVARKIITDVLTDKFSKDGKPVSKFGKDQVSKLNTVLERSRVTGVNLNEYQWETMHDERVRGNPAGLYPNAKPSHWAREGLIFSWSNPPEGGHPGEAPGCRCKARVLFRK